MNKDPHQPKSSDGVVAVMELVSLASAALIILSWLVTGTAVTDVNAGAAAIVFLAWKVADGA